MIITFTAAETALLEELKIKNNLPPIPADWDSDTAEMYRDAANDYEILQGLDENYQPTDKGKLSISISDKLFEVA